MSSPLVILVLVIVAVYLIAGVLRYIRQEWRSVVARFRRFVTGKIK